VEGILDEYQKTHDERQALIYMDAASRRPLNDIVDPLRIQPVSSRRIDEKHKRLGVRKTFICSDPIVGRRYATERVDRVRIYRAEGIRGLLKNSCLRAEFIPFAYDNLSAHKLTNI
jgi:hypothetical protein